MRPLLILTSLAACSGGGGASGPVDDPSERSTGVGTIATPAGPDDVVVARVDGRPIYASCVQAQASRGAATVRAALDECIAFELLAQTAEARGLAADPEVIEATRTALVSRVVEREFEATRQSPEDLKAALDAVLVRDPRPAAQPERRASAYARVDVPAKDPPPDLEPRAKAAAEAIANDLAGQPGLLPAHLFEAGKRHTDGTDLKLTTSEVKARAAHELDTAYASALFDLAEVGRTSRAARTKYGWDVVMLTAIEPAHTLTWESRATPLFPDVRRQQFAVWVNQLAKAQGTKIVLDPKHVAAVLEAEGS